MKFMTPEGGYICEPKELLDNLAEAYSRGDKTTLLYGVEVSFSDRKEYGDEQVVIVTREKNKKDLNV